MRDIREQLMQWLDEIRSPRAELDQLESAVQTTLDAQQAHVETRFPLFKAAAPKAAGAEAIAEFLETTMEDGRQRSVNELVEAARHAGIEFGDKNPNRVVT